MYYYFEKRSYFVAKHVDVITIIGVGVIPYNCLILRCIVPMQYYGGPRI